MSADPIQESAPAPRARPRAAWLAILALPLVPVLWGYNWVVMKSGLAYMGPFEFAAWRFVPAGLLLLGLLAVTGRPLLVRPMAPVAWSGILQTALNTALSLFALRQGPAGRAALLCYTMPFWVVLLGWPILRERPGRLQWAALVAAAAGLALVFAGGAGASAGNVTAVVLATSSGAAWALGAVLTRRLLVQQRADLLAVAAWQMLLGGASLWIAALLVPGPPATWSPYLVFAVLYEILPATAIAWVLWTALLKHVSAGVASLAILATPLVGLLASALQLGERPRGLEAAGLGLLLVALVLVGPLAVRQARRGAGTTPPRADG